MTERKFTDEEVIRALECCANADCVNCPRWSEEWVSGMCAGLLPAVLDLINRQRAEIDDLTRDTIPKLKYGLERANKYGVELEKSLANAKAEAIKEFAERVKEKMNNLSRIEYRCDPYFLVSKDFIDKTAKELTESKPCTEDADCSTAEGKG